MRKKLTILSISLLIICPLFASINIQDNSTVTQLINGLSGTGIIITNPQVNCNGNARGTFTNNTSYGFSNGIILSTGNLLPDIFVDPFFGDTTITPGIVGNDSLLSSVDYLGNGDQDLDDISTTNSVSFDACVLEFDVVALGDSLKFNYFFASEEYPDYNCDLYNDIFAFFISGPGYPTTKNIALVPNTTIPVSINSVNDGTTTQSSDSLCTKTGPGAPFTQYYVDNTPATNITYNGFTTVLSATARVIPCAKYHLKLAIADVADGVLNSSVFIQSASLSGRYKINISDTSLVENCQNGSIKINLPFASNTATTFTLNYSGTATYNVDYINAPLTVTIPAGQLSATVPIQLVNDNITEGIEFIKIKLFGSCSQVPLDSTIIFIKDKFTGNISRTYVACTINPAINTSAVLRAILNDSTNIHYSWSTGDTTKSIAVTQSGKYWFTASNGSCIVSDTVLVSVQSCTVTAPPVIVIAPVSPTVICSTGKDTLLYSVNASSIPANTNVVIYQSTDSSFNPYLGQGDSIGFIPGSSIPKDSVNFGSCVKIIGEFIDACGASGLEGRNEYIILTSGNGIKVSNLGIDYSPQNNSGAANADINTGANPCGYKIPSPALIAALRNGSCNASNVIPANPTDSIPANAIILLFTSDSVTANYSINGLCNLGFPIYILQSSCVRSIGAFTNAPRCDAPLRYRTTSAINKLQNCTDGFTYDLCGIFDKDGTYAIRQQGHDTASVANNGIRRNLLDTCGGLDYSQLNFSADTILKFPIPLNFCNGGFHYIKAITHPNGTQPISNTIPFELICNNVTATSNTTSICSNDSAIINISSTDPHAVFTWTVSGGVNISGESAGTGNAIRQHLTYTGTGTKDSVTYTVISNDAGCIKTQSIKVVVNNCTCTPTITGNHPICPGDSVQLNAGGGFTTYLWNTGATTQTIYVKIPGNYSVSVTGAAGCTGSANVNVAASSIAISIAGSSRFCLGGSTTLTAVGTFDSVRWNTGANSTSITVTQGSSYTVTGYSGGCSASSNLTVESTDCSSDTIRMCAGDSVKLSGPAGYQHYLWTPGGGLSNDTIQSPSASPAINTTYYVSASNDSSSVDSVELVKNGNFEDSLNFWGTDLFVKTPSCGGCNGWYYIGDITYYCANPDHTAGGTLLFNSSPTADTSLRVLYQSVPVKKNTNYTFSAWGYAHNSTPAIFDVWINNALVVNNYSLSTTGCVGWENFTGTWFSGNDTVANLVIKDYRDQINGNDFSLDDISIKKLNNLPFIDSVLVIVNPIPVPVINGNLNICNGAPTTLSVAGNFDSVRWSTNEATSSIQVNASGTYTVTAYAAGCAGTASVSVSNRNISVGIDGDTTFCSGSSSVLTAVGVFDSVRWNTNETTASITVTSAGVYTVTAFSGSCTLTATANVSVSPLPVSISGSTSVCIGGTTTLSVVGTFDSVRWSTNETTDSIVVSNPAGYSVTAYQGICSNSASVQVNLLNPPAAFSLGNDTAFCGGFTKVLSTGDASTQWSTGVTAPQISVSVPDTYIATISNACGSASDTIVIIQNTLPVISLGNDTAFCDGQIILKVSGNFRSIVWSTGSQDSVITVTTDGTYTVTVTDNNGCSNSDEITITSNCANDVWMPNAFSPNGDGINDVFMVRGNPRNLTVEKMIIYNRVGNKIFESDNVVPGDPASGWDGKYKGEPAQMEVYGYYVIAKFNDGEKKILKGNVTLLR